MKKLKKYPLFRDMVRVAACNRIENNEFLRKPCGNMVDSINKQFKKYPFLKAASVKRVIISYLNNIDRGI